MPCQWLALRSVSTVTLAWAYIYLLWSTPSQKRRMVLIDSLICVLFPILCMVLGAYHLHVTSWAYPHCKSCSLYCARPSLQYFWGHRMLSGHLQHSSGLFSGLYVARRHRHDLRSILQWALLLRAISYTSLIIQQVLSLRSLLARQAQFKEFISSNSGLTSSRYFRLMALATTELVFTIPLGIYELYSNAAGGALEPWEGWANTHFDFSRVDQYPAIVWMSDSKLAVPLQLSRWIIPACAFVFFAFFGFAEEARKRYSICYLALVQRLQACRIRIPRYPRAM